MQKKSAIYGEYGSNPDGFLFGSNATTDAAEKVFIKGTEPTSDEKSKIRACSVTLSASPFKRSGFMRQKA
ncbi:MAG: hypothetical protein LBD27_04260 [Tannerella sp.]|nr:hypothetical protein [Tannerella sp.]